MHLSLNELHTAAKLHNPEGESFSRIQSNANSGKSKTDNGSFSWAFSNFKVEIPCFIDMIELIEGNAQNKPKIPFFSALKEKDNSLKKQRGKSFTSLAQRGSGFKDREFKKNKKERLVTKKKSI